MKYIIVAMLLTTAGSYLYAQNRNDNNIRDTSYHFSARFACNFDFPPDTCPRGDTIRARRSIKHLYTGYNFKVTVGYIEKDTVTRQELIDNSILGLRVLPLERDCVVDSFIMTVGAPGSDFVVVAVKGNKLPRKDDIDLSGPKWWHRNAIIDFSRIRGHRISDGKKMYFPPFWLIVKD